MPHLWLRFVDDTFVIQKAEDSQQFLHHINTQDPNIQFTVEEPDQDGSLPFLDTKVTPGPSTVYRKPTHTDQYLHWDNNYFITAKHSVYSTLAHRAKVVSSNPTSLNKEPRTHYDCTTPLPLSCLGTEQTPANLPAQTLQQQ